MWKLIINDDIKLLCSALTKWLIPDGSWRSQLIQFQSETLNFVFYSIRRKDILIYIMGVQAINFNVQEATKAILMRSKY